MTALPETGPGGGTVATSVRQHSMAVGGPALALLALIVLGEFVHGWRVLGTPWLGGDLLYHSALTQAILRGELPAGGPYEGLPAYYPPGFHLLLALTMSVSGLDFVRADQLLTIIWFPVLPAATYLLTSWLTGRPWVGVLAAALTLFAGAYDLRPGRLWVNSLFLSGQAAYPLFPRDIVFGLLPLAVYAFGRSLPEDRGRRDLASQTEDAGSGGRTRLRWLGWSALSGLILGLCALVQIQLVLPIPFALAGLAIIVAWRAPGRRLRVLGGLTVCGLIGLAIVGPWVLETVELIRRNGGVALESSEGLEPATFGFWSYPRQFGLLLPLGLLGAGVVLLFLRRPDGPRLGDALQGRWRAGRGRAPAAPFVLLPWFAVPFALAVIYSPSWPLEDVLRPQRLWLLASQPLAILAAIGLAVAVEEAFVGRWRRPRLVIPAVLAIVLVAGLPAMAATSRILAGTWTRPTYAHLDLTQDRVPNFAALVGGPGPRRVILTYEDWGSLLWYETGHWVVAVVPPGYAKLAYDPALFTGLGQNARRIELGAGLQGDLGEIVELAERVGADRIVLARRSDRWGLLDQPAAAAVLADPGALDGPARVVEGNGWDALALGPGASVTLEVEQEGGVGGDLELDVRLHRPLPPDDIAPGGDPPRVRLIALGTGGEQRVLGLVLGPVNDEWLVASATLALQPGERLRFEALDAVLLQSVRGFPEVQPEELPAGWSVGHQSDEAVVLERGR